MNRYKYNFKSYKRLEKIAMNHRDQFFEVFGEFLGSFWVDLIIDNEFQVLISPLSSNEYKILEEIS